MAASFSATATVGLPRYANTISKKTCFTSTNTARYATVAPPPHSRSISAFGVGKDAVTSWLDLAGFVATASPGARTPFDELADKIGRECYIDVAGWHLYLKDVKLPDTQITLAQAIAQQRGSQIQGQGFNASAVNQLIGRVPVKLGQGKSTLSLADVMPSRCLSDLEDICENYARAS